MKDMSIEELRVLSDEQCLALVFRFQQNLLSQMPFSPGDLWDYPIDENTPAPWPNDDVPDTSYWALRVRAARAARSLIGEED